MHSFSPNSTSVQTRVDYESVVKVKPHLLCNCHTNFDLTRPYCAVCSPSQRFSSVPGGRDSKSRLFSCVVVSYKHLPSWPHPGVTGHLLSDMETSRNTQQEGQTNANAAANMGFRKYGPRGYGKRWIEQFAMENSFEFTTWEHAEPGMQTMTQLICRTCNIPVLAREEGIVQHVESPNHLRLRADREIQQCEQLNNWFGGPHSSICPGLTHFATPTFMLENALDHHHFHPQPNSQHESGRQSMSVNTSGGIRIRQNLTQNPESKTIAKPATALNVDTNNGIGPNLKRILQTNLKRTSEVPLNQPKSVPSATATAPDPKSPNQSESCVEGPNYMMKWKEHGSNMTEIFAKLLKKGLCTDVTLTCQGQYIKCHKIVLIAGSKYFEDLFTDESMLKLSPGQCPVVLLKDMEFSHLKALVNYMYTGELYKFPVQELIKIVKIGLTIKVNGIDAGVIDQVDEVRGPRNVSMGPVAVSKLIPSPQANVNAATNFNFLNPNQPASLLPSSTAIPKNRFLGVGNIPAQSTMSRNRIVSPLIAKAPAASKTSASVMVGNSRIAQGQGTPSSAGSTPAIRKQLERPHTSTVSNAKAPPPGLKPNVTHNKGRETVCPSNLNTTHNTIQGSGGPPIASEVGLAWKGYTFDAMNDIFFREDEVGEVTVEASDM